MTAEIGKNDTAALQVQEGQNKSQPVLVIISNVENGFLLEPIAHIALTVDAARVVARDILAIADKFDTKGKEP